MSIDYYLEKIKPYLPIITIVTVGFLFLGIWQLYTQKSHISPLSVTIVQNQVNTESEAVIGSKTGSKYYFPWCGALSRIKPENRVYFATGALARQSGYLPAGNCRGLR